MLGWLANNIDFIFEVIGVAVTVGTAVVQLFSGKKWAGWIVKICNWLSVVNTEENKEIIKKALAKKTK